MANEKTRNAQKKSDTGKTTPARQKAPKGNKSNVRGDK